MNADIKQRWLAALRSGDYEQGKYALQNVTTDGKRTFCCLGVLCDLYSKETGVAWGKDEAALCPTSENGSMVDFRGSSALPPHEVVAWAELDSPDGGYKSDYREGSLAADNDNGYSFEQIAATVEAEL